MDKQKEPKEDCNSPIENLEEEYRELQKKYSLPDFNALNEDFDIERIAEKETDFILKNIRRAINEKLSAYASLFETLTNPQSASMLIFSILKNATSEDKKKIKGIYQELSKLQISIMKLDTIYDEEAEAKFITNANSVWQKSKQEIHNIFEKFEKDFELEGGPKETSYFG